jgi:hypothetical protein
MHIVSTTDPISNKDLHGKTDNLPYYIDEKGANRLTIYFESEANRLAYIHMEAEPSVSDLTSDTDEWVDEG